MVSLTIFLLLTNSQTNFLLNSNQQQIHTASCFSYCAQHPRFLLAANICWDRCDCSLWLSRSLAWVQLVRDMRNKRMVQDTKVKYNRVEISRSSIYVGTLYRYMVTTSRYSLISTLVPILIHILCCISAASPTNMSNKFVLVWRTNLTHTQFFLPSLISLHHFLLLLPIHYCSANYPKTNDDRTSSAGRVR